MSVVSLVVGGPSPTVVETPAEFEDVGGLQGSTVLIRDLDPEQLTEPGVSYDLRVGSEYRDHRDVGKRDLGPGGTITLHPGAAVILETAEWIQLPKTRFACVVPRVGLLQKGLSNTMSKVDPGYQGHLLVTLFNLGKASVTLAHQERCCSLCVFQVDGDVIPYRGQAKRIEGQAKGNLVQRGRDFLERNNALFLTLLIVVTIVSIVLDMID